MAEVSPVVLIADESQSERAAFGSLLEQIGCRAVECADLHEIVPRAREKTPQWVIIEPAGRFAQVAQVIAELHRTLPTTRVLIVTDRPSVQDAVSAVKAGATDYLVKPLGAAELRSALGLNGTNGVSRMIETSIEGGGESASVPMTLHQLEWEHIQRVLRMEKGNITRTAQALGIHRRSLQRKLARSQAVGAEAA